MDPKISILIDCTGDNPHSITVGDKCHMYDNLEDLGDALDSLLDKEDIRQAA